MSTVMSVYWSNCDVSMDNTSNCAHLIKHWRHSVLTTVNWHHTVYAISNCNVTFEWYHSVIDSIHWVKEYLNMLDFGAHCSTNACTQITHTNPNSDTNENRAGWTHFSNHSHTFVVHGVVMHVHMWALLCACTAVGKTCEASQEVSGSQSPAVRCSVPAPQSCWTSISHGRARSSSQRTMRLITVSTLLLLLSSPGTVPRLRSPLCWIPSVSWGCRAKAKLPEQLVSGDVAWGREVWMFGPC